MVREVRQDTLAGWRMGGAFLLSFIAGSPLFFGLFVLTESPFAVLTMWLLPAVTLLVFWRRGYRCRVCGGRCCHLADATPDLRYHCLDCDIEWDLGRHESSSAA